MTPSLVLVTRPLPEAEETAACVRALGHDCLVEPMLEIHPISGPALDLSGLQAVLVTSRNGARALAQRSHARDRPIFAVGAATAQMLRGLGFSRVESAEGTASDLVELIRRRCSPERGSILHARGEAVAEDPVPPLRAAGFEARSAVLYEASTPFAFSDLLKRTMRQSALGYALFFSPRTARTFVTLARAAGLDSHCADIEACCLSAAVAAGLEGAPWRAVRVSVRPHQDALLDLLPKAGSVSPG